jgi:2-amino-4-hydroxy-6-hydroxymethyldihydropteridine diphosphokinase
VSAGVRAYLALGTNLGEREQHLATAVEALAQTPDVTLVAVSSVYETDPVGGPEQGRFLNAVVAVDTELAPHALLALAHRLETDAQRVRVERWGPRTLDVDVLLYGDVVVSEADLEIPHPRLWERGFVLAPLHDIAPELVTVPAGGWPGVTRFAPPPTVRPIEKDNS